MVAPEREGKVVVTRMEGREPPTLQAGIALPTPEYPSDTASGASAETAERNPDFTNTEAGEELKEKLWDFVFKEKEWGVDEQLGVMAEFWNQLGYSPPSLTPEQIAKIAGVVERNPELQVIPTPLLDVDGKRNIAERTRGNFFTASDREYSSRASLVTPSWGPFVYDKLLHAPDDIAIGEQREEEGNSYCLRYKLPNSTMLATRSEFIEDLLKNGQAVEGEDGTPWMFPLVDMTACPEASSDPPHTLHRNINALTTSDTLLAVQLLHWSIRVHYNQRYATLASEAVYQLDKEGNPKTLVQVASVVAGPTWEPIHLSAVNVDPDRRLPQDEFVIRATESGL